MQIMTKNIIVFIYLIFYHREMVKLDHLKGLSHEIDFKNFDKNLQNLA